MKDAREKIDRQKRKIEDLILLVVAKANHFDHHPDFPKAEKLRNVSKLLQQASHNLWLATCCLLEDGQ